MSADSLEGEDKHLTDKMESVRKTLDLRVELYVGGLFKPQEEYSSLKRQENSQFAHVNFFDTQEENMLGAF